MVTSRTHGFLLGCVWDSHLTDYTMQRISSFPPLHAVYLYRGYFLILLCPVSIRTHTSFRAICVPVGHFDDAFVAIFLEA